MYFNSLNNYAMQQRWSSKKYRIEGGRAASKPCSIFFNLVSVVVDSLGACFRKLLHGLFDSGTFLFNLKTLLK